MDRAGNVDGNSAASFDWMTDLDAPITELLGKPNTWTPLTSAEFSFGCSDGEGKCTFRYLLDGTLPWQAFGVGQFVGAVPEAVTTAIVVTWVLQKPPGRQVSSSQRMVFQLSATAFTAVQFQYRLLLEGGVSSAWSSLPAGKTFFGLPGLPDGNHTLEVGACFPGCTCFT